MAEECAGKFGGPSFGGVCKWSYISQTQDVQLACWGKMAQVSGFSNVHSLTVCSTDVQGVVEK